MTQKILGIILMFMMFGTFLSAGTELAGVAVEETLSLDSTTFTLSGAGIRKKAFLKLYVGSLYTSRSINSEGDVLTGNTDAVISLTIISRLITSKLMAETVQEGFDKALGGNTGSMQPKIDDFISVFSEEIVKKDVFTFLSRAGEGVTAYKNGRVLTDIMDDEFRRVLFSIWLGSDPADEKLKKAMLGD